MRIPVQDGGVSARRVSDADRDHCTEELAAAFGAGRLKAEEFEQRMGSALAATTDGDLTRLTADLGSRAELEPVARPERKAPARTRTVGPVLAFEIILALVAWVVGAAFDSPSTSHALITLLVWLSGSACCALGLLLRETDGQPEAPDPQRRRDQPVSARRR